MMPFELFAGLFSECTFSLIHHHMLQIGNLIHTAQDGDVQAILITQQPDSLLLPCTSIRQWDNQCFFSKKKV
jgi:hypothetical protein